MDMDTIKFESRQEISDIIFALEQWQDAHPTASEMQSVKELVNKLDVMEMSW